MSKGIEANKLYTEGKGEKQPKTGTTCKGDKKSKALVTCLQPDRRVDIEIIGTQKILTADRKAPAQAGLFSFHSLKPYQPA